MTQKLDKFNQAISVYKQKFKMQVESFLKFVKDKVDSEADALQTIEQYILNNQPRTASLTEEQLKNYFHLIAAVQAKVNVRTKSPSELQQYTRIKFKSKKNAEKKKEDSRETAEHKKEEQKGQKKEITEAKVKAETDIQYPKIEKQKKEIFEVKPEIMYPKLEKEKSKTAQVVNEPVHKPPQGSHSPKKDKYEEKIELGTIEQNIVEEDRTSIAFRTPSVSEEFFAKFPEAQMMKMKTIQKQVQIRGYDKFGQNYLNPIIKYRMVYKEKAIYRRYTEFQNLMRYLNKKYEGFILPELPPKEGIKSNLSYFWGVDEAFLNDRQIKLQEMMNTLMNSDYICEDEVVLFFLTNQDYQVDPGEVVGTINYLRSLGEIAFNARQIKSYGIAYYNYFKSFKKSDITTKVTECYKEAEPVLSYCLQLESYRSAITANFDKRRQIFKQLQMDQSDRTLTITQFDKLSATSAAEIRNLQKEMNKYYELKSEESWLGYLIDQKQYEIDNTVEELKRKHKDIGNRIQKMEQNLLKSIQNLVAKKKHFIEEIGALIIDWRRCIHP